MSLMSDIGAVIKTRFDRNASAMTKAQFNALAEERKANRAGSGFDEWGKHYIVAPSASVNTGIFTLPNYVDYFVMGWDSTAVQPSKTNYPLTSVNGVLQKIYSVNVDGVYNTIKLPTAPNIYPYDAVLTTEQINSGVIKHADSSNSGLIVNGKFDTDTSGWVSSNGGVISYINGNLQITKTGNGWWQGAKQTIPTVIGKKYVIEATISENISAANVTVYAITTDNTVTLASASRVTLEFIATAVTSEIFLSFNSTSGAEGSVLKFDNIAVYPADAISRSDFVFLESWHEDISEKNFIYPLGNVQYLGANTDGLTGIVKGSFTGFETYSLFGNWQTPSTLIGKGYVWSSLTEAQKKAFIANPENNCYLDGGKVIQVRYRIRVVQGWGDNWFNVDPQTNTGVALQGLLYTGSLAVQVKGKQTSIDVDVKNTLNNFANNLSFLGGSSPALNKDEKGVFGYRQEIPSASYTSSGFALPIALVHR